MKNIHQSLSDIITYHNYNEKNPPSFLCATLRGDSWPLALAGPFFELEALAVLAPTATLAFKSSSSMAAKCTKEGRLDSVKYHSSQMLGCKNSPTWKLRGHKSGNVLVLPVGTPYMEIPIFDYIIRIQNDPGYLVGTLVSWCILFHASIFQYLFLH